jgi:hypothetical protein
VLRSVMRQPRQLPALLRVAADARAAQLALRAGRRRLGPGLNFPGFQPAQREITKTNVHETAFVGLTFGSRPFVFDEAS